MATRITPDEDEVLRRLNWFERFGAELAPSLRVVKATIRSRDTRSVIREPSIIVLQDLPGGKPVVHERL